MIEVYVNNKNDSVKLIDVLEKHSDDKIALVRGVCFHGQRSIPRTEGGITSRLAAETAGRSYQAAYRRLRSA